MRATQAEFDEAGLEPTGDDAPGLEPSSERGPRGEQVPASATLHGGSDTA